MSELDELENRDLSWIKSPPERRSLAQQVYDSLKQAIVEGRLSPGSRVVESRLAKQMKISRTPVREAIHKLESQGFLQRAKTGAFYVMGLNKQDVEEIFGLRKVLESYAARLAAYRHQEQDLTELEKKIQEYQSVLQRGQLEKLPRINTQIHDLLYALSKSPRLINLLTYLREQIFNLRLVLLNVRQMAEISNQDHIKILHYIRQRDADNAEKVVQEHICRGKEAVLQELDMQEKS